MGLEEKPQQPKSNYAIPGIYFYDGQAGANPIVNHDQPAALNDLLYVPVTAV